MKKAILPAFVRCFVFFSMRNRNLLTDGQNKKHGTGITGNPGTAASIIFLPMPLITQLSGIKPVLTQQRLIKSWRW